MSEECCKYCGEIAENEETVWGYLYWCDSCEDAARQEIYDGVARRMVIE
tara:strand:+ start:835 stop:981 length:147 start_codon:yes stop_codon:yes gene_type:complete